MNIFINGCSHTEGTKIALDNDLTKAWPFKLQKRLNCEVTSIARAGCSNDRIVRTTIESIATSAIPPTHELFNLLKLIDLRFQILTPIMNGNKFFQPLTLNTKTCRLIQH